MRHLLLACDFSPASTPAIAMAKNLALTYGARVSLLHDFALLESAAIDAEIVAAGSIAEMEACLRKRGTQHAAALTADFAGAGLHFEVHLVRGEAGSLILSTARRLGCDLIVLGSRGLDAYEACTLGSVSTYVLQHGECPILIVPGHPGLH